MILSGGVREGCCQEANPGKLTYGENHEERNEDGVLVLFSGKSVIF